MRLELTALLLVGCSVGSGGNPFDDPLFEREPADLDCTPLTLDLGGEPATCLLDMPATGDSPALPDGDYHLTSFRGDCIHPWLKAVMRVTTLDDGRVFIQERRTPMVASYYDAIDYTYLWDGGSGVQIVCGAWDAPVGFTPLDSVESGAAPI